MPPKNMISVPRNHHIPSDAALRCCSTSAKWCRSSGRASCSTCSATAGLSLKCHLFGQRHVFVCVGFFSHHWYFIEVECGWRRRSLPLEPCRVPGICLGNLSISQGPEHVNHRQQISDGKNGGASSRKHIQHLIFRRILPVPARHSKVAENELREEREVEANEYDQGRQPSPPFGIHPTGNFRPPEVHAAEVSHDRAADHHIVEVRDHEIRIVDVDVNSQGRQKQSGEPAYCEQTDKTKRIQHRRRERNRPFVHGRCPVEYLYSGRHRHQKAQEREHQRGIK